MVSPAFAALKSLLSEITGRSTELSAEMAAQKYVIDQFVANNSGGVPNDQVPIANN